MISSTTSFCTRAGPTQCLNKRTPASRRRSKRPTGTPPRCDDAPSVGEGSPPKRERKPSQHVTSGGQEGPITSSSLLPDILRRFKTLDLGEEGKRLCWRGSTGSTLYATPMTMTIDGRKSCAGRDDGTASASEMSWSPDQGKNAPLETGTGSDEASHKSASPGIR